MPSAALSGKDTITINSRVLTDLADGDAGTFDFPNVIGAVKSGKNGNTIFGANESGKQMELKVRVLLGSGDDKFLNALFAQQRSDLATFPAMTGEVIKKIGDGSGNLTRVTYVARAGIFTKPVGGKTNAEGDTEQSVAIYTIMFGHSDRVIT